MTPKLSIITVNFNNADGLLKTIQSVICQIYTSYEYIVIDGGSTDNSIKTIKSYNNNIDYWVTEKDDGIYHAMNKGIEKAKGEYLLMLNSGDALFDNQTLNNIFFEKNLVEDIIYGMVRWESDGNLYEIRNFPKQLTFRFFWNKSLGHQSTFIKKKVHEVVGLYDSDFRFISDWKFFVLAICKYNVSYNYVPIVVSICDTGGVSWDPKNFPLAAKERDLVLSEFFPLFVEDYKELDSLKNEIDYKKFILKLKIFLKKIIYFY